MMYRNLVLFAAIALQRLISSTQAVPHLERRQVDVTVTSAATVTSAPAAISVPTVAPVPAGASVPTVASDPAAATVDSVNGQFQSMLSKFLNIRPTKTPSSIPGT